MILLPEPSFEMARERPKDLPDYNAPPVTEAVLGVQFAPVSGFGSAYAGLFWESIRDKYPKVSEQPPLGSQFETFGGRPTPMTLQVQAMFTPPMPRFWFESEDGSHLVQLQQDRILHNWRKQNTDRIYPRYESIRDVFLAEVMHLNSFFAEEKLGEVRPTQCEVTYINTISLEGENPWALENITPLWQAGGSVDTTELENTTVHMRRILRDAQNSPCGRLYINLVPYYINSDSDFSPVLRVEITTRLRPSEESIAAAFEALDVARETGVRAFARVTRPNLQENWGRISDAQS